MPGLQERNDFRRALQEACEIAGVEYTQTLHRRVHDELHASAGQYDGSSNDLSYSELVQRLLEQL